MEMVVGPVTDIPPQIMKLLVCFDVGISLALPADHKGHLCLSKKIAVSSLKIVLLKSSCQIYTFIQIYHSFSLSKLVFHFLAMVIEYLKLFAVY